MAHPAVPILEKYKALVWPRVEENLKNGPFPNLFEVPDSHQDDAQFHADLAAEYPRRKGKYVRPTLVMLAGLAMGVRQDQLITTAAAMQLSEEWLLVHDDIEDGSLGRRGKPALHLQYDVPLAINAGDTLHNSMWSALLSNRSILGDEVTFKIAHEFTTMLARTGLGQTTEIRWTNENRFGYSDEDWFFVCDGKTSYYTIALPMRLGAIIAGATDEQLAALDEFGIALGRCFQITDDILDVTGDFGGQKGQVGNDVYEGKRTLILGHLYRSLSPEDQERLRIIMSLPREQKSVDDVAWILEAMKSHGSIDYARQVSSVYKENAQKIFDEKLTFLADPTIRAELATLIDFIQNREY